MVRTRSTRRPTRSNRELQRSKPRVDAALRHQGRVCALFHDVSLLQHHDTVCVLHRRQPVGDDQRGAAARVALHGRVQRGLTDEALLLQLARAFDLCLGVAHLGLRLRDSLDQIFAEPLPGVIDSVESKFFGIGLEAYTVGSAEFYANYAATHPGVYNLMDSGHYHPEESIADKIPAQLAFYDKLPLHVTRPMHWDSDHVVTLTDDLRGIADEIVRCNACDKALIGLDFFDGSINRVAAWVIGTRNMQKALLLALLTPHQALAELQDSCRFTELLALQEEYKSLPWGEVWAEYCRRQDVPENEKWLSAVQQYERQVLAERK